MESYVRGQPVPILQKFWTVDPVTDVRVPADPTTVVFTLEAPNRVRTAYVWNVDTEVTRVETGVFLLQLSPPDVPGVYQWRAEGAGAVVAAYEDSFEVLQSAILDPDYDGGPTWGPCTPWISGQDVLECGPSLGEVTADALDDAASDASSILWSLSGRRFGGICRRTVRPCRDGCRCWSYASGFNTWSWTLASFGAMWPPYWVNEHGGNCGCGDTSVVKLAGYPVRTILEVKIDGVVLPALDGNGDPNYRLDGRRNLVRMDSPDRAVGKRRWPACQNISLDDTEQGTFSVSYEWGVPAPVVAKQAASQLARELFKACRGDEDCQLPSRVTRIQRMGVTIDRLAETASALRAGASGLELVDAFIAGANPGKISRRPAVWSPDKQKFARKVGP